MRVFVARHGERKDFVDAQWRDGSEYPDDPPLTELGEAQARRLGEHLKQCGAKLSRVYASPFSRCVRTATLAVAGYEAAKRAHATDGRKVDRDAGRDGRGGDNSHDAAQLSVAVEPGLCERLSFARYWTAPGAHGPAWRNLVQLAHSAGVHQTTSRVDMNYEPRCPFHLSHSGFPESVVRFRKRCRDVVGDMLKTHHGDGDILIVGHISSSKAIIDTMCPGSTTWLTSVSYCCVTECERLHEAKSDTVNGLRSEHACFRLVRLCDSSFLSECATNSPSLSLTARLSMMRANLNYLIMVVIGFLYSFIAPAPKPFLLPASPLRSAQSSHNDSATQTQPGAVEHDSQ